MGIEDRLREALSRQVARAEPAGDAWSALWSRVERKDRRRRLGAVILAFLISAIGLVGVWSAFRNSDRTIPGARSSTRATSTPVNVSPRIVATIPVGKYPSAVATGEGGIWVTAQTSDQTDRYVLVRIDPGTDRVTASVSLNTPGADVAVGAGAVWVTDEVPGSGGVVLRVEPATTTVTATVHLDCRGPCFPLDVAADQNGVWVTLGSTETTTGEVVRIDPNRDEVAARIPVDGTPMDLVAGEGGVWVFAITKYSADGGALAGSIFRIDPLTDAVVATLLPDEIGSLVGGDDSPPVMAAGGGAVWVVKNDFTEEGYVSPGSWAVQIDPQTDAVVGQPVPIDGTFAPIAVEEGGVWFVGPHDGVSRLDTATMAVDAGVAIDETVVDAAMDPATGSIWLVPYKGPVVRIDVR
jgi:hypothetical protein